MGSFIWRGRLKVSVGEVSRASALEIVRDYNAIYLMLADQEARMEELQTLVILKSPVKITLDDAILESGTTIKIDEEEIRLAIPLTREAFKDLPFSLTNLWADAAVASNQWVVDDLKNALSRAMMTRSEQGSGSAQSSAPTEASSQT